MGCPQQTGGRETDESVLLEPLPRDFQPYFRSNKMQDPCSGGKVTAAWIPRPRAGWLVSRAGGGSPDTGCWAVLRRWRGSPGETLRIQVQDSVDSRKEAR